MNKIYAKIFIFLIVFVTGCSKITKETAYVFYLENPYIKTDTVWQGEIVIKGIAVVKKNATLKILPGTKIKFIKTDLNKDNVGDGEIIVEGKLIAKGEKNKPIIFTSAEINPNKKDWTYIYVERNNDFLVENCIFSYAFTGLQIHYSQGVVKNNLFENNFEGLRYSTAQILIQNNIFKNNNYGIRFESRRSNTEISYNEITKNDYGIFSVMRSTKDENKIFNNNIYNNSKYNFLIGIEQTEDLDAVNNWWGTDKEIEILNTIFDKNKDVNIGKINFIPILKSKIEIK